MGQVYTAALEVDSTELDLFNYSDSVDIQLTNLINSLHEEEFLYFCKAGEDAGVIDASEFPTKLELIKRLGEINEDKKKAVIDNLRDVRHPFYNRYS